MGRDATMILRTIVALILWVVLARVPVLALETVSPSPAANDLQAQARQWEKGSSLRDQVYDQIQTLTRTHQQMLPALDSKEVWKRRKSEVRRELTRSLFGSDKLPARTPLNARVVGTVEYPDYTIEKVVFEAWPGVPVPAHLYLPRKKIAQKLPCVLHIPGHYYQGKTQTTYGADPNVPRHFCVGMVRHGIAVLIYDPMSQGERTPERSVVEIDHGHWFPILDGFSQMGLMVWESIRAIDYIQSRTDLDGKRIGVTGCSGGGENTPLTCAIDNRPAASVPVCYPVTYVGFMKAMRGLHWNSEVDICNNVLRAITYSDHSDWMACFAPKPQMLLTAIQDDQFPVESARELAGRMSRLYDIIAPGKFRFHEFDCRHSYNKDMRELAYGFFLKHLAGIGNGSPVPEAPIELEEWNDPKLMCFNDGYKPAGPLLARLFSERITKKPEFNSVPSTEGLPKFQSKLRSRIREACHVPDTAADACVAQLTTVNGISLKRVLIKPVPDITLPVLIATKAGSTPDKAVVIVSDRIKSDVIASDLACKLIDTGHLVCIPDMRTVGELSSHRFEIAADLWMFSRTLTGEWIADSESIVRYLKIDLAAKHTCLVGTDSFAETAILAAAVVPEKDSLVSDGPLTSYWSLISDQVRWDVSAYIPGIMKHFDLTMAFAAIAPRKAVVLNPVCSTEQTRLSDIYKPASQAYNRSNAVEAFQTLLNTKLSADIITSTL